MAFTLRQARRLAELTQTEAAERSGLSNYRYNKIEKNPECATIEEAKRLSAALGIPLDELFFTRDST